MLSVSVCNIPKNAFLSRYQNEGVYTDCFSTNINQDILFDEYIEAFYTTNLFRAERTILKLFLSKPSTDEDVHMLAQASTKIFTAWSVEAREANQIILSDYQGRTRSWLMCEHSTNNTERCTRLYFGSAVLPIRINAGGNREFGGAYSVLLPFHKLYSRALLWSAGNQLSK